MLSDPVGLPHPDDDADALPPDTAEPFRRLLGLLAARGLRHCHWKSSVRLEGSLRGGDDLDLLVHRDDAAAFLLAAAEAGFRLATSAAGLGHPGVVHALALDPGGPGRAPRLAHLHAYFQVLTGDSLVKSWHLPVEGGLLAPGTRLHGLPVPPPEAELALFAMRVLLKHGSLAEAALAWRDRDASAAEIAWLRARATPEAALAWLAAWCPAAGADLVAEGFAAIAEPGAFGARVRLGRRLARRLAGLRRIGPLAAAAERWRRVGRLALGRLRGRRDLRLVSGGALIAIVGPKASGKSTLGRALREALGGHLDLRHHHLGKPGPTWLTALPHLAVPLARAAFPRQRSGAWEAEERRAGAPSLMHALRMTLLAHDRRALLRRAWREAAAGAVVVTDRYPALTPGAIDGGRFGEEDLRAAPTALHRWLMRRERELSRDPPPPSLVIRLEAGLGVTVARDAARDKPGGPDPAALRRRFARETAGGFGPAPVLRLDTARPLEASVAEIVAAVWARL